MILQTREMDMRKVYRASLLMVLSFTLMIMLGACGKNETGVITGELVSAMDSSIVISTDEGTSEIKTGDNTVYNLGDAEKLSVGDTLEVSYHKKMGKMNADKVTVKEHIQEDKVFEGTVVQVTDKEFIVNGKSLTISFSRDEKTKIDGKLSVGDKVEVVYTGDISEYPYAAEIRITEEKDTPKNKTVSGIVSEFTETTMMVAIDSANSTRFTISPKTKIYGAAKYIHTGDSVNITYSGELDDTPLAVEINVVKVAQVDRRTINGKIYSVENGYITLDTGKRVYVINVNENTKYSGEKPKKGYLSEITYTGKLGKDAVAVNVYCIREIEEPATTFKVKFTDGNGKTINTQTVEEGKAAKAPANPTRKGYRFKGWDKDFSKVTKDLTVNAKWEKKASPTPKPTPEPDPEPDPEPTPVPDPEPTPEPEPEPEEEIVAEGVISDWTSGGDSVFRVMVDDGGEIELVAGDFTEIASGYFPAKGDKIKVTYKKSDLKALKIELVEKGGSEEEPSVEPEPEPEPVKEPDVIIEAKGSIVEGNEEKKTCTIKLDNGEEVTLNVTGDTKIASGYFPQKEDVVKVTYNKTKMELQIIELVSRPEPEPADEEAAGEEAE